MKYILILCFALVLASCATPEPTVATQVEYIEKDIPVVPRPKPVDLVAPEFHVVNPDIFEEFITEFRIENGTETFVAFSVQDYENMSIGVAEIQRYLEQQNQIIDYYEEQVSQ